MRGKFDLRSAACQSSEAIRTRAIIVICSGTIYVEIKGTDYLWNQGDEERNGITYLPIMISVVVEMTAVSVV